MRGSEVELVACTQPHVLKTVVSSSTRGFKPRVQLAIHRDVNAFAIQ